MKISIIIPIYNKSKYLPDLLSDLLMQTFTDYQCILVNDGSTDNSGEICDNISKSDNRFKAFHLKNGGVSAARNFGIDNATGEYITFIDADDRLCPEHLENLYHCIAKNDVDMAISGIEKFWPDSDRTEHVASDSVGRYTKDNIFPQFAYIQKKTGLFGFCVSKILRRELIQDIRFDTQLTLAEDFDFYLKVYSRISSLYLDDKCYYRYLQVAENSSALTEDNKIDYYQQLIIRLRYKQFLIDENMYSEENKQIVDSIISNYVYFVLFYSSVENILNAYIRLSETIAPDDVVLPEKASFQRWILWLFKARKPSAIKFSLWVYRCLASIKRKNTH